jgi:hypothetical protein
MKKFFLLLILIFIMLTSLVKNSTKEIEDKIFVIKGNIRSLSADYGDVMLEYNYLSSPEKLTQYQSQYFDDKLKKIDITKIKKVNYESDILNITDLKDQFLKNE